MCGRHKLAVSWAKIHRLYSLTNSVNLRPRYNIAPTQDLLAVIYDAGEEAVPVRNAAVGLGALLGEGREDRPPSLATRFREFLERVVLHQASQHLRDHRHPRGIACP
jgi:putative SOS response-associated peptidase YedK